jgi:hypothetical protein
MLINVGDAHIFVTLIPTEAEEHGLPFEMLKLKYIGEIFKTQSNCQWFAKHDPAGHPHGASGLASCYQTIGIKWWRFF